MTESITHDVCSGDSRLKLVRSPGFVTWLSEQRVSLALTTYQTGKLFLFGRRSADRLSMFERSFNRCIGLWSDSQTIWMTSLYQLWRFENVLRPDETRDGYDRLFVPQVGYVTGDLDIHDVAVNGQGQLVFVNTMFSCLATTSDQESFVPLWRPAFVTDLCPEDRCHLNGLAMHNGRPRYVTAAAQTDSAEGWREERENGGCVIDVEANEVVLSGLSMPHSPRVYRGRLWLLDSGSGFLGFADVDRGRFERLVFCPGYLRGLTFIGDYAVVTLSLPRSNETFSGLQLEQSLAIRKAESRCGVLVVDLRSGTIVQFLFFDGIVRELYDVVVLPEVQRPYVVGFKNDQIQHMVSIGATESELQFDWRD